MAMAADPDADGLGGEAPTVLARKFEEADEYLELQAVAIADSPDGPEREKAEAALTRATFLVLADQTSLLQLTGLTFCLLGFMPTARRTAAPAVPRAATSAGPPPRTHGPSAGRPHPRLR